MFFNVVLTLLWKNSVELFRTFMSGQALRIIFHRSEPSAITAQPPLDTHGSCAPK